MAKGITLLLVLVLVLGFGHQLALSYSSPEQVEKATELWQDSIHAFNNVNCSACHQNQENPAFVAQPTYESCQSCHQNQVETFLLGKHGIRLHEGLSPLQPKFAQIPMQPSAKNRVMNCGTCHNVHSVNTQEAAVSSCLTCHADIHSLNYKNSRHAEIFFAQESLDHPSVEAVSCATCHLPRQTFEQATGPDFVGINHNNTLTLKPRDRMVKAVCMNCHGMEYSYNSIFDDGLVESNFDRPPTLEMETLEMIRVLEQKRTGNSDQ